MPRHNKTTNLSNRSKRRRVAEYLKNSSLLPLQMQNEIKNITSINFI